MGRRVVRAKGDRFLKGGNGGRPFFLRGKGEAEIVLHLGGLGIGHRGAVENRGGIVRSPELIIECAEGRALQRDRDWIGEGAIDGFGLIKPAGGVVLLGEIEGGGGHDAFESSNFFSSAAASRIGADQSSRRL